MIKVCLLLKRQSEEESLSSCSGIHRELTPASELKYSPAGQIADITRRKPSHFRRQAEALVTKSAKLSTKNEREGTERHYC